MQKFLREKFYQEAASDIIVCVPKNSSELLHESIEQYRAADEAVRIHEAQCSERILNKIKKFHQSIFNLKCV